MTRKQIVIFIGILFLLVVSITNTGMAIDNSDNPIDQAFAKDFTQATATPELNYVAEKYMQAWKAEMNNAAAVIKQQYQFAEDKARIDTYTAAYEQVAAAASSVAWLNWSDTNAEPKHRNFGTGAASASLSAKANIYKQATVNLINMYQGQTGDNPNEKNIYSYAYSGNGAELAKIRKQHRN